MKISAKSIADTYTLSNKVEIPIIGFGTWQTKNGQEAYDSVKWALSSGYRHIDTAAIYKNEISVGQAIHDSNIKREDLFITTKLWNSQRESYDNVLRAFNDSLVRLKLDYVDLYLIHWPVSIEFSHDWHKVNAETWRAMEDIYKSGRARAIGISNFRENHILELKKTWEIAPMVNQIFLNPGDPETDLVKMNQELGILTEAYSPLGTGKLLHNPILEKISAAHYKTVPQILIRWSLEQGYLPLPKSTHERYIKSNIEVFDFELSSQDYAQLETLAGKTDQHQNPDTFNLYRPLPFI
ncbi:aldo/keto reductase [Xylocopilactobacillus apis]|uniref:Oxidoreductase n=1 Tax=Xylocopilactobacillus apis TaxID=2932183 RepID=A0AAU9CX24_9LACO|nr:aldo/keto reductase [Xylocopilactobacillus apis]BDR55843.1 oxidoreductase [Xylocopilactobacillus apis]